MGILDSITDKRNFAVSAEKAFVLSNGEKLRTLDQLSEAINLIEPEVFIEHVNNEKNDFAAWIDHVFEESVLAQQLREHPTPLRMMVSIEKFLRQQPAQVERTVDVEKHEDTPAEEAVSVEPAAEQAPAAEPAPSTVETVRPPENHAHNHHSHGFHG